MPTQKNLDYRRGEQIALPYFRCTILSFEYRGKHKISRPERKDRVGHWVSFYQVEERTFDTAELLSDKVFYLNRKAQRLINLNSVEVAVHKSEYNQKEEARKKMKRWVGKRFNYLSDIYREDTTTIFAGKSDRTPDIEKPFWTWVPTYLAKKDMTDELSVYKEKKQSLGI